MVDTRHKPDRWSAPRSYTDPSQRLMTHGKIQPMLGDEPGLLERLVRLLRR